MIDFFGPKSTNWLTFEPYPDHIPYAGTGLLPPILYRLRNIAALPSLAYFSANLAYFVAISVSICAKLACIILIRDRNTATEPNFRKTRSKCRILSPKNSYLSISHVNQQQHCSSTASVRPMTARSIFSLSVFTFLLVRASFRYKRKFAVQMCAEIHRHWQLTPWSAEKLLCVSDLHADISNIFSGYGENGVTVLYVHTRVTRQPSEHRCRRYMRSTKCISSFFICCCCRFGE